MANGAIKGITIKLGVDASDLATALDKADSSLKVTQKQLNEVNKALKFNPNNIDLLRQKEELLTRKIQDTKTSIDNMKLALKQMDEKGIEKTSDEYMTLQRSIIEAESKQKKFNKELKELQQRTSAIGQLSTKFNEMGSKLTEIGNKLKTMSVYAGATATAIGALAYKSAQGADDLNTLSKQTGIATDQLQLYARASELVDVSVDAIAKANVKLKKNMLSASKGTGATAEAFKALGVNVADSNGALRDQDSVFQETLKALGEMENETERDAYAMQIFGKSAYELNPLIEDAGKTYKNVSDMFKENGIEIADQKTLDEANKFNDAIDKIKASLQQAFFVTGAKLAETLAPLMEKISTKIQEIAGWIANLNPHLLATVGAIAGIVAGIAPALIIGGKLIKDVGKAIKTFQTLFSVLSANPIVLVVAGITALVAGLVTAYKKSETFRNAVNSVASALKKFITTISNTAKKITSTLSKAFSKISSIGKEIVSGLWNGIKDKTKWLIDRIKEFANNIKDKLKSFFGIASPSKWARDMIGKNIALGVAQGINGNSFVVNRAMGNLVPDINTRAVLTNGSATGGNVYSFGNITVDVSKLKDVATVEQFVDMMKRAKAFA